MPKLKITKYNVDRLEFTQQGTVDYWDDKLKGFGLRVGTESKTFFVKADAKTKDGFKTVKSVIGKYGLYTVEQAREVAQDRILKLKQGDEPIQKTLTLREMLDKHLSVKNFGKLTDLAYRTQVPAKFSSWMDATISEISKLEPEIIIGRFRQIEKDNGRMTAKNALQKLQAIMNHAKILYPQHVIRNPCEVISQLKLWPKVIAKTDCLKGSDFKQFYDGLQNFNEVTRDCYLFCLYSGLRKMEASALLWEHVEIENAVLNVPDTKNHHPLYVPLSRQSVEILKRRLADNSVDSPYVFKTQKENLNKSGHVDLASNTLKLNTGLVITVHGLRRTFVDIADNKLKLRRQDVDRLTNHVDSSVTGRHYSHKDIDDLRPCIQAIGNEIERLMLQGIGAKVIPISSRQAA